MSVIAEKWNHLPIFQILQQLKPIWIRYRLNFTGAILLILISAGVDIWIPMLIGESVDAVTQADTSLLTHISFLFLFLIVLKLVLDTVKSFWIQSTGENFTHDLRCHLFGHIERFTVAYFDRNPVGRSLTRVINDIKTLGELFTASMSVILLDCFLIIGTLIAMFALNFKLACLVLAPFPIALAIAVILGKRLQGLYRKMRHHLSSMNAFLGENIGAIATIQRLAAEGVREKKFQDIVDKHQKSQMDSLYLYSSIGPSINIVNALTMATLLTVGGYWAIDGRVSLGIIVAYIGYLRNLFFPLQNLIDKYNVFASAKVSAERIVSLLHEKDEHEGECFQPPIVGQRDIQFCDVSFQYPTRHRLAISQISFKLPEGESLAIVGATGSGKSTLIRLLLRFYEPGEGEILYAGFPLSRWNKQKLRQEFGVVHQEIYLLRGTLRDNLLLEHPKIPDRDLIAQCQRVQLWEAVKNRGGLDMAIDEGGANLSIGEKQLISFARILVFNPPVLILDEATASIDRRSETRLMEAISELISGRTAIVIAHRLSTIRKCNQILVLENGQLVQQGSYQTLVNTEGAFKHFHDIS